MGDEPGTNYLLVRCPHTVSLPGPGLCTGHQISLSQNHRNWVFLHRRRCSVLRHLYIRLDNRRKRHFLERLDAFGYVVARSLDRNIFIAIKVDTAGPVSGAKQFQLLPLVPEYLFINERFEISRTFSKRYISSILLIPLHPKKNSSVSSPKRYVSKVFRFATIFFFQIKHWMHVTPSNCCERAANTHIFSTAW